MRLFLAADIASPTDKELGLALAGTRRILYLPSKPDPTRRYFNAALTIYRTFGIDLIYADPAESNRTAFLAAMNETDGLHLPDGDTVRFLRRLVRFDLLDVIRSATQKNKPLVGIGAGAVLTGQDISIDMAANISKPPRSLNLAGFDILPHVLPTEEYVIVQLMQRVRATKHPILCLPNGTALIVEKQTIRFVGKVGIILQNGLVTAPTPALLAPYLI